jgi:hypothetical protein
MSIDDRIHTLVLQEFRLQEVDADGRVANIVASSTGGIEPAVPLLTSIDDRRHVATVRALRADESREPDAAQRAALEPFVSNWKPPKHYTPRITEQSENPSTYFRLAVTESGINNSESDSLGVFARPQAPEGASTSVGLLWVGLPHGTHAGLLILLGSHDDPDAAASDPRDWASPLSRDLGVRIYDSRPEEVGATA